MPFLAIPSLEVGKIQVNKKRRCLIRVLQDTYGGFYADGTMTQGGYSSHIRAHEHFTFPIPEALQTELAAPMLCAGLTAYSPLVRNGAGPGKKVGIVGM
jgi:alcohol dehydrogenase (NADP+)